MIINRTSKGGEGEFVGISSYYDYSVYGKAQHNQGIYKVFNYEESELIYITCLLNSQYYRKYCANLSMGSKMKELKLNNILEIPFPNFPQNKKLDITKLYYNKNERNENVNKINFVEENYKWDINAGILDLFFSIEKAKKTLNEIINNLYKNNENKLEYKIF